MPKTSIKVKLVGEDGNAFAIIGRVCRALREGGRADLIESFKQEATSGSFDQLLQTVMAYCEVE